MVLPREHPRAEPTKIVILSLRSLASKRKKPVVNQMAWETKPVKIWVIIQSWVTA